jgi:membrane protein implicated in regulation of membrane protease activity
MFFLYPMWDHESQRIGKKKCTSLGYALHTIAELLGFIGMLFIFGIIAFLVYRAITGNFHLSFLWLFIFPFALGLVAEAIYRISWVLAAKRGFEYDYEKCQASWNEDGKRVTYKWEPGKGKETDLL